MLSNRTVWDRASRFAARFLNEGGGDVTTHKSFFVLVKRAECSVVVFWLRFTCAASHSQPHLPTPNAAFQNINKAEVWQK